MLLIPDKDMRHCFDKAAECNEKARKAVREGRLEDERFWLEREEAWLRLARSYALASRVSRLVNAANNRVARRGKRWPATLSRSCPLCRTEAELRLQNAEQAGYHCESCGYLFNVPL